MTRVPVHEVHQDASLLVKRMSALGARSFKWIWKSDWLLTNGLPFDYAVEFGFPGILADDPHQKAVDFLRGQGARLVLVEPDIAAGTTQVRAIFATHLTDEEHPPKKRKKRSKKEEAKT